MESGFCTGRQFLITGGAGFIGSAVIRFLINHTDHHVLNVDKLTYAGNLEPLGDSSENERYQFAQVDFCDSPAIERLFQKYRPDIVMHMAAESQVDRSISSLDNFIENATRKLGDLTPVSVIIVNWNSGAY